MMSLQVLVTYQCIHIFGNCLYRATKKLVKESIYFSKYQIYFLPPFIVYNSSDDKFWERFRISFTFLLPEHKLREYQGNDYFYVSSTFHGPYSSSRNTKDRWQTDRRKQETYCFIQKISLSFPSLSHLSSAVCRLCRFSLDR